MSEKTRELARAAQQMGKTLTFMETMRTEALRNADPKAAARAKRYIWSRIERNETTRRAGK